MSAADSHLSGEDSLLHRCASHFADAVRAFNPEAQFTPQSEDAVKEVELSLPLTDALRTWYQFLSPAKSIEIAKRGNWLRIYSLADLVDNQVGYRWTIHRTSGQRVRVDEWAAEWVVIGDTGSDPLIADVSDAVCPVFWDMHGQGSWSPTLMAPSLAAYLEAEALWIETCLVETGVAQIQNWNIALERIWDGGSYRPNIAANLRRALEPVVTAECLSTWDL